MKQYVIISGGGTGGHIYPALATAEALQKLDSELEIIFVGAEGKMETQIIPHYGYPLITLPIRGFQRRKLKANLKLPLQIMASLFKALKILNRYKPVAVVGTGGYVSLPIVWLGQWLGLKTFIQEQNSFPGWTNRILGRRASGICVAYPKMSKFFPPQKTFYLGNPIRKVLDLERIEASEARNYFGLTDASKPCLLVLGGSLGAKSINENLLEITPNLLKMNIQIIWQTGKGYYERINQNITSNQNLCLKPFIDRMDYAYKLADLVVARGGALTISELALMSKPAILVPSPNVTDDHQRKNISALVTQKAAYLIEDAKLKTDLKPLILKLLNDENQRESLSANIKTFAKPTAASDFARLILGK